MIAMLASAFTVGLFVALPPGPITIAQVQRTLSSGFWSDMTFTIGVAATNVFYLTLLYFGFHMVFSGNLPLQLLLFCFSGAWLIYLGVQAFRQPINSAQFKSNDSKLSEQSFDYSHQPRLHHHFYAGAGLNLLNPLTIVGWMSIGGNFFSTWNAQWPPLTPFGWVALLTMVVVNILWAVLLITIMNRIRQHLSVSVLKGLSRLGGSLLIGHGLHAWLNMFTLLTGA